MGAGKLGWQESEEADRIPFRVSNVPSPEQDSSPWGRVAHV